MVKRIDRAGSYYREPAGAVKPLTVPKSATEGFVTEALLERHFLATEPAHVLGFHALGADSMGLWAALDIDAHTESDCPDANERFAVAKYAELVALCFRPLLTESDGKGGYHLRILFRESVAGPILHRFALWMTKGNTLGKRPESFPKQAEIGSTCLFGNWLRAPGKHPKREFWSRVWSGSEWLEGRDAVAHILGLAGDDPALIPAEVVSPPEKQNPPPPRTSGFRAGKRPDAFERACRYLRKCEPSVSGQMGHDRAFSAARAVRLGFNLSEGDSLTAIQQEFNPRCEPPWSERELLHKIRESDTKPYGKPRGYLLNSGSAYDPTARARQWGGSFGATAATDAEPCNSPPEPPDDEGPDDEADGDCEAPTNFADPFYVARLFLGHMSAGGWFAPLPRGAMPFVRTWRQEFFRFDGSRYRKASMAEMVAELGNFLEALYLSLYLRGIAKAKRPRPKAGRNPRTSPRSGRRRKPSSRRTSSPKCGPRSKA